MMNFNFDLILILKKYRLNFYLMVNGDWGLGIGDWGFGPKPNTP